MTLNLILISTLFIIFIIFLVLYFLTKNKIKIKYSIIWLLLFFLLLVCLVVPGFLSNLTKILGFQTPSNMIFSLLIAVLVVIPE